MSGDRRGCFSAVLRRNTRLSPSCSLLELARPDGFPDARPGQFVSVRISDSPVPLLGGADEVVVGNGKRRPELPVADDHFVAVLLRGYAPPARRILHLLAVLVGPGDE